MKRFVTTKIPLDDIIEILEEGNSSEWDNMAHSITDFLTEERIRYGLFVTMNGVKIDNVIEIEFDADPTDVPEDEMIFRLTFYTTFRRFLASYDFKPRKGDCIRVDCTKGAPKDYSSSMRISIEHDGEDVEAS